LGGQLDGSVPADGGNLHDDLGGRGLRKELARDAQQANHLVVARSGAAIGANVEKIEGPSVRPYAAEGLIVLPEVVGRLVDVADAGPPVLDQLTLEEQRGFVAVRLAELAEEVK
jgi:hypothetical protein